MTRFDNLSPGWGTDSKRWGKYPRGVLPLWVADMDFPVAEPIRRALASRIDSAPLWYSKFDHSHSQPVVDHLAKKYNWHIDPNWLLWLPGVMAGIYQSVLMQPQGAGIICQTPVYPPLRHAAQLRRLLTAPAGLENSAWRFQWPEITTQQASMLLLCHPHNPTGREMSLAELRALGDYARKNNLLIASDEIHADLVLDGQHLPFAMACLELAESTLTFMAASKAFNIAGLGTAFAIIPNGHLRQQLAQRLHYCGEVNNLGVLATLVAFSEGGSWLEEVLHYLRGNRAAIDATIAALDGLDWLPNQATHLGWIDCSAFASPGGEDGGKQIHARLLKAKVAVSSGSDFGDANYVRINYATSRAILDQALESLTRVCRA